MKKLAVYLALCACLFSCKKDTVTNPSKAPDNQVKKYAVTFQAVDAFTQEMQSTKGVGVSDAPLKEFARHFIYIVYASNTIEYQRIEQDSSGRSVKTFEKFNHPELPANFSVITQETFGCIKDTLPAGDYTIVMMASKRSIEVSKDRRIQLGLARMHFPEDEISFSRTDDTFFKKFQIKVSSEDIEQNVPLDRIVGKAEFLIKDARPNTNYKFLIGGENYFIFLRDGFPSGETNDTEFESGLPTIPGKPNLSYSKYILSTVYPVTVQIKGYENGKLTVTKTIRDVQFQKNKRIIFTGNIHPPIDGSSSFTVTIDDEFDGDSSTVQF